MLVWTLVNNLNMNHLNSPSTIIQMQTADQATQVSFPVLLRSQQKALKRYATLTEFKHYPPRYPPTSGLWTTAASAAISRPKSLNIPLESFGNRSNRNSTMNLNNIENTNRQKSPNNIDQPGPVSRSRLSTMASSNTLSPKHCYGENQTSYAGSDVSNNDRNSTGESVIYSTNFKSVHQSKWKIGLDQQDSLSTSKTMCSCHDQHIKELKHTTTPEGLSWRRLHMSRAKLKATATTSELLSGFAMVAMVELQINEPTTVPEWLFVLFAVCTTILVAVHIFALMISTYILPNIDAISKLDVCELVSESPHERMKGFIELAWAFSTVLGLFLFLVEIAILCWVKFWDYSFTAAIAATVIVIPVLVVFVAFAIHFYHSLVVYKCDSSDSDIQQLETMKKELDLASSPV